MNTKQKLGQFFTTNYSYIMDGMNQPPLSTVVIEPFAGDKDMLHFIKESREIECYDIEPRHAGIIECDTLTNPPSYTHKYVITNPPYLARNKAGDKTLYDLYNQNDLYKCFVKSICDDPPIGGIIIVPLNFWCSIRKADCALRALFLETFRVDRVNAFEERVFDDTSYTVCCIQFSKSAPSPSIPFVFYPERKEYRFTCSKSTDMIIGGELYALPISGEYRVGRMKTPCEGATNIKVFCLDTSLEKPIRMEWVEDADRFMDTTRNSSERSFATLVIDPPITIARQRQLIQDFNQYLTAKRSEYKSMFLSNYRESSDLCRKRISFKLVYGIVHHLLTKS